MRSRGRSQRLARRPRQGILTKPTWVPRSARTALTVGAGANWPGWPGPLAVDPARRPPAVGAGRAGPGRASGGGLASPSLILAGWGLGAGLGRALRKPKPRRQRKRRSRKRPRRKERRRRWTFSIPLFARVSCAPTRASPLWKLKAALGTLAPQSLGPEQVSFTQTWARLRAYGWVLQGRAAEGSLGAAPSKKAKTSS